MCFSWANLCTTLISEPSPESPHQGTHSVIKSGSPQCGEESPHGDRETEGGNEDPGSPREVPADQPWRLNSESGTWPTPSGAKPTRSKPSAWGQFTRCPFPVRFTLSLNTCLWASGLRKARQVTRRGLMFSYPCHQGHPWELGSQGWPRLPILTLA